MIRATLFGLMCLTQPLHAQSSPGLDFEMMRATAPDLERWFPPGLVLASLLARDRAFYDLSAASSPITSDIADFLVDGPTPVSDTFHNTVAEGLAEEFTPDELLALWFSIIDFGNDCIGIDAAMEALIGKSTDEGTLFDFVTLMTLTVNPKEDINHPGRIDTAYRALVNDGFSDDFIDPALAAALLERGPSRIISSDFCGL